MPGDLHSVQVSNQGKYNHSETNRVVSIQVKEGKQVISFDAHYHMSAICQQCIQPFPAKTVQYSGGTATAAAGTAAGRHGSRHGSSVNTSTPVAANVLLAAVILVIHIF